jgi:UDP-N-acetylmuramoyl-tripeptide--D-alanyl-D-alanine ligase
MKTFDSHWIARALQLPAPTEAAQFQKITADSRAANSGTLFVALKGEKVDGHDFLNQAKANGATGLVHRREISPPTGPQSFPVADTLDAWRKLSKAWRKEFSLPLAAVAGSAGKTTSKELLAALFRGRWQNVLATEGSQNGFQGIPTTLLRLTESTEAAVIEVGIDEPGAMIQHLELVQPDAGLLTSIGPEHLEKLIDLDTVEKEEGLLFQFLEKSGGLVAINLDDERIVNQARDLRSAQQITYSLKKSADVSGKWDPEKQTILVKGISANPVEFPCPLPGAHNALNLLGAVALAHALAISPQEMLQGLKTFQAPPGRSEVYEWQGRKVYGDFYNSNPSSVSVALDSLALGAKEGIQLFACLGDMLEMGSLEERLHRDLADSLLAKGIHFVYLYGPRMKNLEDELKKRNFSGFVKHFATHENLANELIKTAKAGDRLLLKGSRGMKMEKVWEILKIS